MIIKAIYIGRGQVSIPQSIGVPAHTAFLEPLKGSREPHINEEITIEYTVLGKTVKHTGHFEKEKITLKQKIQQGVNNVRGKLKTAFRGKQAR